MPSRKDKKCELAACLGLVLKQPGTVKRHEIVLCILYGSFFNRKVREGMRKERKGKMSHSFPFMV